MMELFRCCVAGGHVGPGGMAGRRKPRQRASFEHSPQTAKGEVGRLRHGAGTHWALVLSLGHRS